MFDFIFWSFCVLWGLIGVAEALPYQQGGDGTNIRSEEQSGKTKSFQPTPSQYYECFGTNICETGVHFCSENRRACEKCSDFQAACGTNLQRVNCTGYCMKLLMEGKCNETVTTKPTLITTEKAFDDRQTTNSPALIDNPETHCPWKWICIILIIALAASLSCNVYQRCYGKQSKQMEHTEKEQTELLSNDQPTDSPADTPSSFDLICNQCTSVCLEDKSGRRSVTPPAPFVPKENLDQNETSEIQIEEPNQVRESQAGLRDTINEFRGPEVDTDKQPSSGCSSASSTLSRNSSRTTNNTTINIKIHNEQTGLSITSTDTKKKAMQPENSTKEVRYGVEETDADFNHGKLVSDENTNGNLAFLETAVDIDDLKKASLNAVAAREFEVPGGNVL